MGNDPQEDDTEGVGKGDDEPQQHPVHGPPTGTDHIGGDQGLAVSRFKGVQGAQGNGAKVKHEVLWHLRGLRKG